MYWTLLQGRHTLGSSCPTAATPDLCWCHLLSVSPKDEPRGVIEEHTHQRVKQLVAQAILVTVVHPLADPEHGGGGGVLGVI